MMRDGIRTFLKHFWLPVALILVVGLGYALFQNGAIGISRQAMAAENTKDGYDRIQEIGETMAVFVGADEGKPGISYRVYVKHSGTIGWFFRLGASLDGGVPYMEKLTLDGNREYVLLSTGRPSAIRIEIDQGDGMAYSVEMEPGQPFAAVIESGWAVTILDENGDILRPVERNL